MNAGFRLAALAAALNLTAILLSACSLQKPRLLDHESIVQCGSRKVVARIWQNAVALRFQLPGRDAFAVGQWNQRETAQAVRLALAQSDRTTFASTWKNGRSLTVLSPEVWRNLVQDLADRLAPQDHGSAALLCLQGHELLAIRRPGAPARLLPFVERQRGLRVAKSYSEDDLAEITLREFSDHLASSAGKGRAVLIATGQEPPLVLFSPEQHRLVFLHEPPPEVFGLPLPLMGLEKMPPEFAYRTAKSLLWSGSLLSALNNPASFLAHGLASTLSFFETFLHWRALQPPSIGPTPPVTRRPDMDSAAWERELDRIAGPPTMASIKLEIDGLEFFQAFIQAAQDARESIDVRIYIFDNDDYAVNIANLLRRRSMEGVRTRVLMDELGSLMATSSDPVSPMPSHFSPPGNMVTYLEEGSHVKVREIANPFLTSSHTKTIIVDGRKAWFGGMNIGREYRYDWHDLMVEVSGPLVTRIQRDFGQAWARAGWAGDLGLLKEKLLPQRDRTKSEPLPAGAIPVRPLYTSTFSREIVNAQLLAMRRAQRRIWIENAYITSDAVTTELIAARRRGVDVRVIYPVENDAGIMGASNLVTVGDFLRHGIRVFGYPRMSHVKAAIYDGWACLGSANFDRLSFSVNNEFDIGFSDPAMVKELESRVFLKDFAASREIHEIPEAPWTAHLAELLANQL